ncbi:metallophosphoesterase family protein [Actinomadura atramentaria]|uniref:metallophosphoesterase family protein n=1 Tax=Actinomadura atramentaria TaxID=1990 RepID=UPI00037996BA|nr:metallophosphoesterase [Actinomadura atramentaria]
MPSSDALGAPASGSSRTSEAGAGWVCGSPGRFEELVPPRTRRLFWWRPSVLWRSRNDLVARVFGDPTDDTRRAWVAALAERGTPAAFTLQRSAEEFSFVLMGDTGEGDRSQYAVVPALERVGAGTDFMVIASDVIYPTGDSGDYPEKFFRPYRSYPGPIFAVPGNHDWYDGLRGFVRVFCDLRTDHGAASFRGPFAWLARLLWRTAREVPDAVLDEARAEHRGEPGQRAVQPGPYWAIDTPDLRIVGIDTGITGDLDREQGAWLRGVSAGPKPKLLVTGKPLIVDDQHRPGPIEGGGTVDEIVRDPVNNYVAAIGGDIHNYQRYPVRVGGRTIQYVVAGGGGAFMHATHVIRRTTAVDEDDFRCYPLRGDSLSRYAKLYGHWTRMPGLFDLTPREATAAIRHRLGIRPARDYDDEDRPSRRALLVAALLGVPRGRRRRPRFLRLPVRRVPQWFRSELADWDSPPFFKSLLRLDVTAGELRIRCFGVSGCGDHEANPPLEDEVRVPLVWGTTR